MKVLQVLPELNSGGVERGTVELGRFLVQNGHESLVLSNGGRLVSQLENEGTRHITLPVHKKSLISLRLVPKIVRLLKDEQPDILHLRSRAPAWLCYLAWKKLPPHNRPRLITTVHGFYSVNFYSAIMTKGEAVICVSNSVKDYVLKNYPKTNPEKLVVIHRGVEVHEYTPDFQPSADWLTNWNKEHPDLRDKNLVTLPGRITRWKGHLDFLEVLKNLRDNDPSVHGLVAGGAHPKKKSFYDELRSKTHELGLQDHVTFLGHRSDLREILSISTIVLSLSRDPEAFGRVSLEALALGKPVAAYAHGGVAEQLEALFPEGMIPPGNTDVASSKLSQWLAQTPPSPRLNEQFTLESMLTQIVNVYHKPL